MNDIENDNPERTTRYQANRLKSMIEEISICCQDGLIFQAKKFDLTPAELRSLLLFKNERYLTVTTIAQKLEVAKSRVTKILDGLLNKKLVQRIDDPEDARIKLISLTPTGQKKAKNIEEFMAEMHHCLLLTLKPDDRKSVLSSLELLRSTMEEVKEQMV